MCIANGFSSIVSDENDNSDDEDIRCAPISLYLALGNIALIFAAQVRRD